MTRITESAIEKFVIEPLEYRGCQYVYAPSNSRKLIKFLPLGETEERVMQ